VKFWKIKVTGTLIMGNFSDFYVSLWVSDGIHETLTQSSLTFTKTLNPSDMNLLKKFIILQTPHRKKQLCTITMDFMISTDVLWTFFNPLTLELYI
jgi:hypothetical protein